MSAAEKPIRPGMFCDRVGATGVDEFGVEVACVLKKDETRARWRRPEDKAGRQRKARAGTRRARSATGRRTPSSATYTGVAEITAPTLPFMPVVQLPKIATPPPPPPPAPPAVVDPVEAPLTDDERALLEFELRTWISPGAKESAILQELKMSAIKYWQKINQLLNRRAAFREYPGLVSKLDKIRVESRRW